MIVHTFSTRNDDWCLGYHLTAFSAFCDRIICILDRSPQSESICRRFPKVEVHHYQPTRNLPDANPHGVLWEDGRIRQLAWDLAAAHKPDWIALADADEVPTPDVLGFAGQLDLNIDAYYSHWVNLWKDSRHALGGENAKWSFQNKRGNKKPLFCRRREGVVYRYDLNVTQHGRMEPNPLHTSGTVLDTTHVLVDSPKLIHLKYANWPQWEATPLKNMGGQYTTMDVDATIVDVPHDWHWPGLPPEVQ